MTKQRDKMTKFPYIVGLDEVEADKAHISGGKFAGLVALKPLIEKYNAEYGLKLAIPQTFAITLDAFERYNLEYDSVPDELVNQAMQCAVKLGGNVAVRSSADVEDKGGKTYSGQFDSVLNVKNKAQMRDALNQVYASAKTVENAKMGIILQSMIDMPQMAGVAYSESWYGDPFVVINYVENELADELVAHGGNNGHLFAVSKPLFDKEHKMVRLNLATLDNPEYKMFFYKNIHIDSPEEATAKDREDYRNQFIIAALAMQLEQDLGHQVDMEFAISADGKINILQQRPYLLPRFYKRTIDSNTTTYFSFEKPFIDGYVGFVNVNHPWGAKEKYDINIWKTKEAVHIYTKDSVGVRRAFMGFRESSPFAADYSHCGNMEREQLDFSEMETWGRSKDFEHIKEGDYMWVNLLTGEFNVHPKEKKFEIDFTKMLIKNALKR